MWTVDVSAAAEITTDSNTVELRSKERAIVAALALHHPTPARAAELAPLIWGDEIPATANKAIHNHVSRLRRSAPELVTTADDGYRLAEGTTIATDGSSASYADLADQPQVAIARARDRRRTLASEDAALLDELHSRPSDSLANRIETLVDRAPHRFIRWWWLTVITARLGRRRDALDTIKQCRRWHATAGASPTQRALNRLEIAIIDDDVFIDSPAALSPRSLGGPDETAGAAIIANTSERGLGTIDPMGTIGNVADHIDGAAGSLYVLAPAGGGKTTAVRSVVEQLSRRGWNCFTASCSPIETNPLHTIADLREQVAARAGDAETRVTHERRASGGAPGEHLAALIAQLVRPQRRRTLLVVDDVHHADATTQTYLQRLANGVDAAGPHVALLLATRDIVDGVTEVAATTELTSWNAAAVGHYLESYVAPGAWADGAIDWIWRTSNGNPLYVRELTIDVLRKLPARHQDEPFVAPSDVDALATSSYRIAQLRPAVRAALEIAATLGDEFRRGDLARLTNGTAQSLAIAEAGGLIETIDDERLRFVHQTFRQTLLDSLPTDDQVAIAQRVAAVIGASADRDDRLSELARFARTASSRDPERAISTTLDAAVAARGDLRFEEALALANLARTMIADLEGRTARWCSATVLAGGVGIDTGDPDAVSMLVSAGFRAIEIEEADIVGESVWYLSALGPNTAVGEIHESTDRLLTYALDHVRTPAVRARVCAAGSFSTALAEDPARSRELFVEADEISAGIDDPHVRADVLLRAYTPLSEIDDVPRRRGFSAELRSLGERFDRIEYSYEACRLDFGDAIQWGSSDPRVPMQHIEEIAAQLGQLGRNWSLTSFRAAVALLDGDLAAAEDHANVLLTDQVTVGEQLRTSTYGAQLIAIRMAQNRTHELDPLVASLVESQPNLTIWRAIRSLTASTTDRHAAIGAFDSVFTRERHSIPANYTMVPGLVAAAEGAIRIGDADRITTMLAHLTPFADRWAFFNVGTVGPVDLTLARLHLAVGDLDAARACVMRGLRSTSRVGAPLFASLLGDVLAEISSIETT